MGKAIFLTLSKKIIPNSPRSTFWLTFTACFLVCMGILFIISPLTGISRGFGVAHDGYLQLAQNLAKGNGYVFEPNGPPVFHRPPLYPFLLVPIAYFPDYLQRPILVVFQSLLAGCINMFIFQIALKLFSLSVARVAVWVFLLNPWVYWNVKNPMTPILQSILYIVFLYLLGHELLQLMTTKSERLSVKSIPIWLPIGFVGAALALSHGTMLAVTVVMLAVLIFIGLLKRNLTTTKNGVLAGIIVIALIAPWTYRNWIVFNQFIPVVGGSGLGYFNGNVHWAYTEPIPRQKNEHTIDASLRVAGISGTAETHSHWWGLKDIKLEKRLNKKMIEDIRSRPLNFVKKITLNSIEFYFPAITYPFQAWKKGLKVEKLALTIFHLLLWTLTLLGFWHFRKNKQRRWTISILIVAIILYSIWYFPILTFVEHSLYTFGTIPILSILASVGIVQYWKNLFNLGESVFVCHKLGGD